MQVEVIGNDDQSAFETIVESVITCLLSDGQPESFRDISQRHFQEG